MRFVFHFDLFRSCESEPFFFELSPDYLYLERTDRGRYWFARESISEKETEWRPCHGCPVLADIRRSRLARIRR